MCIKCEDDWSKMLNVTESSSKNKCQFYVFSAQVHEACCGISMVEENDLMSGQYSYFTISDNTILIVFRNFVSY